MNRKRQQAEILFQAGQLFGPMLKMIEHFESYDEDERTRIVARYFSDVGKFSENFLAFTKGEPGHAYQGQYHKAMNRIGSFGNVAGLAPFDEMADEIKAMSSAVFDAINSIPVPIESSIHEAHTPFSTYCLVKDMCSTARSKIDWMDRYLDSTIFGRYFIDIPEKTLLTLVTWPETKFTNAKDRQRYADFIGVSRLFAQERGPERYRLLTAENFHDRRLRCDDKMVLLGDSIKDLGKNSTFTISRLDSTEENQKRFEEALTQGTEIFGPTNTTHP